MTDPIEEKLLDRVRKLLAKAENEACTPAESEAFNAKAAELIAKYGIEQAMLIGPVTRNEVADRKIVIDSAYASLKATLLYNVGKTLGCRAIRMRGRTVTMHLFGLASDIERAELLYTSLLIQSASGLTGYPTRYAQPSAGQVRAWRAQYLRGFTNAVLARLRDAERRAQDDATTARTTGPSVALVLSDRKTAVDAAFKSAYPSVVFSSGSRVRVGDGYRSGQAAGRSANLGGTGVRGGSRVSLGR